jgi:hypothetical protein
MISIPEIFGGNPEPKQTEEQTGSGIKLVYKPKKATYSGSEIRIIPCNPGAELTKETAILLITYLSTEFPDKEISGQVDTSISFVDCGECFEKVICPGCGNEIQMEFWQEAMEKASVTNFRDRAIKTNCCNRPTDLNALKYVMDCGFAKTILVVNDPAPGMDEAKLTAGLKSSCGIDFKIIYTKI